jgi:hypothetical protein
MEKAVLNRLFTAIQAYCMHQRGRALLTRLANIPFELAARWREKFFTFEWLMNVG